MSHRRRARLVHETPMLPALNEDEGEDEDEDEDENEDDGFSDSNHSSPGSRSPARGSSSSRDSAADDENPGNVLFVSGFSKRTQSINLLALFSRVGTVTEVRVVSKSRGFGFVTMECTGDARRGISYFHNTVYRDRIIAVEMARNNGTRTASPRRDKRGWDAPMGPNDDRYIAGQGGWMRQQSPSLPKHNYSPRRWRGRGCRSRSREQGWRRRDRDPSPNKRRRIEW